MDQSAVSQIEDSFRSLSISEQLLLIERLVRQVHQGTLKRSNDLGNELALMAADPEIRNELERIEQEFSCAAADGLENI